MMKLDPNINIPNPCDRSYAAMESVDSSCKFCTQCSSKVYDFTNCSEEDFKTIFEANNGNVCGRIKLAPKSHPSQRQNTWFSWVFSFLAFIGIMTSSCTSSEEERVGIMSADQNMEDTIAHKVGKVQPLPDSLKQGN